MKGTLYNHPRLVILILILIVLAGLNAFNGMPRLEDPHVQSRVINVVTFYPGADAERVEAEVTEKLEGKLREVAEVKQIFARSLAGISSITLELEDYVDDAEPVTALLRDKVSEVTDLPAGASEPRFNDKQIYAYSSIIAFTWRSPEPINYAILGRHAAELSSRLKTLSGTDFTDIQGLPQEEIRVELDDTKLAAHGLSAAMVAQNISRSDARGSSGSVSGDDKYVIEIDGALDSLERLRRVPLGMDAFGSALRLGDVADVSRTYTKPLQTIAYINGEYGVTVSSRMDENTRIDLWALEVEAVVAEYTKILPDSLGVVTVFDQSRYAEERLFGLLGNLAMGALVVLIVLLISLGWRASLVSASILPLTLLAALAVLSIMGFRIQQVVVMGMIVALGIMVDNAIVITEEIQHQLLKGVRRSIAVANTVKKLWLPLFGSTLTTIIAFMPLVLMPGNAGDYLIGIPGAVIASLVASYVIAFTIISALAGRVVRNRSKERSKEVHNRRIWWKDGIEGDGLSAWFKSSLEWSARNPMRSMLVASLLPITGFFASTQLTELFFPKTDRDQFIVKMSLPSQATIEETRGMIIKADKVLHEEENVAFSAWYAGDRVPKFYMNMIPSNTGILSYAEAMVTVHDHHTIPEMLMRLQARYDTAYPEVSFSLRGLDMGPPVRAPIEVRIVGPDFNSLQQLGEEVRGIMNDMPMVTSTRTSLVAGRPTVTVEAREDSVSVAGLTLRDVADQVRVLTDGVMATSMIEDTVRIPVKVIGNINDRNSIEAIRDLNLVSPRRAPTRDGSFANIPLSAIADVNLTSKIGSIERRNGERVNTVQGFITFDTLPETAFVMLQERLAAADIDIPPGFRIEFGGESAERDRAVGMLFATVGFLVMLMVMAIVLTFNSFRLASVTFVSAIQSAGLGFLALWFFDFPISFLVIIGLMGLIGLAINATIVILSELKGTPGAWDGDADAVVTGVMNTGRHILSTTLTTVGGFTPLILAGGGFWPPFAVAIAGGAFMSMIVSFYFAPAAFLWYANRSKARREAKMA